MLGVSIHAPRVGSDSAGRSASGNPCCFNPRSPRGERLAIIQDVGAVCGFNPRSPRGERRDFHKAEMDKVQVSIHAPRVGSDSYQGASITTRSRFNPRSPRGERHQSYDRNNCYSTFQSTLPAWGATSSDVISNLLFHRFNPRSPRGERQNAWLRQSAYRRFNPRSPRGERQTNHDVVIDGVVFQSTLPAWGATRKPNSSPLFHHCFNPRSPRGERLQTLIPTPLSV